MLYRVFIGLTEQLIFTFDNIGDAIDFTATCLENGYRATVVPVIKEDDE